MKSRLPIVWLLFMALASSACGTTATSPSPMPSPAGTTQPSIPPDPAGGAGSCHSGGVAAPDIADTWSPPPEAASITPLSRAEIGKVFAYDPLATLDIREMGRRREEGVTLVDLTYASPMGGRVPATLVVPDGGGPHAGMLYQHGMPSRRQDNIPAAVAYGRMGAVVLLIDAPLVRRTNGEIANFPSFTEQDRRDQIQLIVDLRRGIDLLVSRPDVDPERLAYVGKSYGAIVGGLLAGVEDRLKAYVLFVGNGGLVTHMTDTADRAWWMTLPEEVRRRWVAWMWPIEPIHYVGWASPAALLFQNGTRDIYALPADALSYQEAGSEPKTVRWYRVGHNLGWDTAAFRDQAEWLSGHIGISVGPLGFPVDPQVLAAYAGRYELAEGITVTLCVDGTHLVLQVPDEPKAVEFAGDYELLAAAEDHFQLGVSEAGITFFRGVGGGVDRMIMDFDGHTTEARKLP